MESYVQKNTIGVSYACYTICSKRYIQCNRLHIELHRYLEHLKYNPYLMVSTSINLQINVNIFLTLSRISQWSTGLYEFSCCCFKCK